MVRLFRLYSLQFSLVQSLSRVQLFVTPWIAARQASLSIIKSRSSLRLTSIESVMPSSHLILCRPLLLLPPIPPTIRVFSNESTLRIRWPEYWSFSFSIIPSKEIPGLISFRMNWLDLLAVHGTLKSLLQHHSSKASFFGAQPSSQSNSPTISASKEIRLHFLAVLLRQPEMMRWVCCLRGVCALVYCIDWRGKRGTLHFLGSFASVVLNIIYCR